MNPNLIDPLPAGAMTWGGKTFGPAINMGRARPHMVGGRMFYLHLDELRDAVVKAGWHTEDDYQRRKAELKASTEHIERLQDLLADADDKIDALERALFHLKPTGETTDGDGENRERDVQEGRTASVARSSAGSEDPGVKDVGGKGRKVRATSGKTG